jgi:uncharacterized 2Fe-2S/4Fe-4S cluster protein (DUF4445 family)
MIADPVALTQTDIRELQLAKGAIAAGVRILLGKSGLAEGDIARVYLAGAFGNYVNTASAKTIGLVNFPPDRIVPSGNTALRGAKRALFDEPGAYDELASGVRHIALDSDGDFQDVYVEEMRFPTETGDR